MKKKVFSLMMTLLLAVSLPGVMFAQNRVSNGTHGTSLKAIASSISAINRSTPAPSRGNATIVLNVPGDIWEDGTGYQLLLDADHNTYGSVIPETGNFTAGTFADFEYTIPENAVCDTYTNTIVVDGSESITIPAGVYDYVFLNPYPGGAYYIASDSGFPGRGDNYEFESGKIYTFTLSVNYNDYITLTVTDSGDEPGDEPGDDPTPGPTPGGESDLHTLATYGVGNNALELTDLLVIERPNGAWMEPYHFNLYNEGTASVEVVLIDFLHNNGYFRMDEETTNYPFTVLNNGRPGVDLYINTNMEWTSTDLMESLLAVNTTERSTHLYNILAAPYTPYCPDVVEKAYNIGTITTGTTWHKYASEMWNEVNPEVAYDLHDNYTLPFPEIPEGYDAVMKFTADHDIMLNAYVSDGENGKVALYREDFAGRPGPMADNNYTMRPFNSDGGSTPAAHTTIDFETGNFSQFSNYTNDATYPWYISANAAYTGSYGMMSGNAGVDNSASIFNATVNYTTDGTVSFDFFASGESGLYSIWDKCVFQIDGEEQFRYGEENVWDHFSAEVASGVHTFTWIYEKDYSLAAGEDCFKVDNIVFEGGRMVGNRDLATSFEGSLEGWTTIDADGDGFNWMNASVLMAGYILPSNSGEDCVSSQSYDLAFGALTPDNYLVSPQIQLGGRITFYASAQDPSYAAEHFGVAVSTTNNTNASSFTTISEWTISAKSAGQRTGNYITRSRDGRETEWVEYTVDLSAYSGQGYVAIRHFGCTDQFYLNVDDVTIVEGVAPTPDDPTPDDPTPVDPTPDDPDTPVIPTPTSFSAGPVIENLNVLKGTYYLVASSTDPDFEVTINYEELPCPIAAVTNIYPEDNAWGISPENLILRWKLNDYANEWRLVFSSTYWPEDEIDTEHPATYVTEWSSNLQESFNISAALAANGYHLWNNTNYFWRIDQRSNPGTEWECYTQGPVFGFTTTFNVPQHLTATNTRIFEYEETVTLSWDPIVDRNNDRTYRRYRVYMDGERIYDTPDNVVTTSWDIPQDLLTYNMYNEHGYVFNVTAVYDEGESPMSNPVEIWVSGNGNVSGTAYEQDGVTPIGGVTVTIQGFNEFNAPETYTFITDENGYYEGPVHAGTYPIAIAQKEGYQDAITVHPLPLHIVYQELTDHVDFIMDEVFYAPAHVCAEPVYVPGVEGDTLVQVWWDFNFFTELRENFEDWDNTPFAWQNDATYPWTLTTNAHEGTYALKSGNAGVTSSSSAISVTVNIPQDGMFSFEYNCQGEGSYTFWDHCDFVMDGNTIFSHGADLAGWQTFSTPITAGTHSFTWSYTKDSSVNPTGDCFTIDNIVFVGHPEDVENSRALHHFNIYRTDCYNDGPYNDENTTFLATVWRPDTSYFDVSWPEAPVGVYKYGVSAVYSGNQADNPNNPRVDYPFEDRESEIVWHTDCKPCIDKDMYLYDEVTVNVVMNSADSPEGTRVTFTNTNPGEQFNHPMEPIILPESGFYRFPSFRKGNYNILVEHAGFETILDYQEIWTATDLRYVMIEIIYNPINLYVSRTGWAMWEPFIPDGPGAPDTPDTPDTPTGESSFSVDFENGFAGWTTIDADGDGLNWVHSNNSISDACYDYSEDGHNNSAGFVYSQSYTDCTYDSYDPDNFLVSPQKYGIVNGSTLSFWADYGNDAYPDHFGVAVATADNPTAADFTMVWEGSAKSGNNEKASGSRHSRANNWRLHNVDLSAYAGQNVWIAFRHFNSYDEYEVRIDDVALTAGRADRHLEGYKVLCTSIDGEPIFNHNTVHPFCQLGTVDPHSGAPLLVEGNYYICKVAAIYSTGMSDYISCTWQYEPCEHWAGTLNGVTAEGNTITWDYPNGDVPGPIDPPQPTDEATIVLNVPGDIWGDGTGYQLCLDADHNTYGSTIPTTGNFSAGTFADFEYTIPENAVCDTYTNTIVINGSQSITVPAGVYDYVFLNPYPGGTYYIASDNGNFPGRGDDYEFEGGKTYTFTLSVDNYDAITLTITDSGRTCGFACNKPAVDNSSCRVNENFVAPAMEFVSAGASNHAAPADFNRDGWLTYDYTGAYYNAIGLTSYAEFSYGNMHPASQMAAYNGQSLTKVSLVPFCNMTGSIDIYQGGTTAPETLVYTQPISLTGVGDAATYVDVNLTTPVVINGSQSLWVIITASTYDTYPAAMTEFQGDVNGSWLYLEGYDWMSVGDAGIEGTWMVKAYVEEGTTPPTPPTPGEGILGAMIFVDGEWEAFVEAPTNTYTYEGDGQEICVRIVYDGANELPDNNYYYAMSCEECIGGIEPQPACEAGAPLFAEVNNEFDQVHLYWAEQPEPPTPTEGTTFSYDFENNSLDGLTQIDADGDGNVWLLASETLGAGYGHNGSTDMVFSQSYVNGQGALFPDNYLVFPVADIVTGSTFSFYACGQDASWASEHFGVAVSTDGTNFTTIQEWTMTAKGGKAVRDGRDQGNWYNYSVDLSDYAGEQVYIALRHFNCSDMFYLDVDDVELSIAAKGNRDGIVAYNIYRSVDGAEFELIGTVPGDVTEYFDTPEAGTYYYQVTAVYADGCESAPAVSGIDPTVNYVVVGVTGIGENEANVNLFPNPTKGNVTIQAKGMNRITVVSVLGQVVFDTELDQDEYIMNMAQFNTGLYMVRVYTNEGVTVKRVTVMH